MDVSYKLFDIAGNEARHFTVKVDSTANRLAGAAPPAPVYNYTYLPGVAIPFVGKLPFCDVQIHSLPIILLVLFYQTYVD